MGGKSCEGHFKMATVMHALSLLDLDAKGEVVSAKVAQLEKLREAPPLVACDNPLARSELNKLVHVVWGDSPSVLKSMTINQSSEAESGLSQVHQHPVVQKST